MKLFLFPAAFTILWIAADCCTPPFVSVADGCYFYSGSAGILVTSRDAANEICLSLGGHLAMVKHGEENRAIVDTLLIDKVEGNKVLLGATRNTDGLFEWIDESLVRDTFTIWAEGEPSGNGDCMGYSTGHSLMWDDFSCANYTYANLYVGFLCEDSLITTTEGPITTTVPETTTTTSFECPEPFVDLGVGCYYCGQNYINFGEAIEECEAMNSHLAYIKTEDKQIAIEQYLEGIEIAINVYIGGFDINGNDTLYWLDGTAIDDGYTNYCCLGGGEEDALYMYSNDWTWGDVRPIAEVYFLCEMDFIV